MDNKSKIIIGLAIVILGLGYYSYNLPRNTTPPPSQIEKTVSNYDKQSDCAKHAEAFFNYYVIDSEERKIDEYSNHYNLELDKCFVLLKYPVISPGDHYSEYLFDAIEKREYGNFTTGEPLEAPLQCKTLNGFCYSKDQFDDFVGKYMED